MEGGGIEHLQVHGQASLLQHHAERDGLHLQLLRGNEGDGQAVRIARLLEETPRFVGVKGIRRQGGIIAEGPFRDQRRDDHAIALDVADELDRKSTRLNSSHLVISYAVFCLKKKKKIQK